MFEYWQQVVSKLDDIDISLLSPQTKDNIIPYLNTRVDENSLVHIIAEIENIEVHTTGKPDYIFEDKYLVQNDTCYLVNPLNTGIIQAAYENCQIKNISFSKRGIIATNTPYFKKQKQQNIIHNEHESKRFFTNIINTAIANNATDIHIAPRSDENIYFRLRINGMLVNDLITDIDTQSYKNLANQIIGIAGGEPDNFNTILAKKFIIKDKDINATFRLSMMPTEFMFNNGYQVPRFVLRVHNNDAKVKNLQELGLSDHSSKNIQKIIKLNQGLIVVTGPTGSGKTTLLYAILNAINSTQHGVSIQTAEDPVEKILPLIDQCSVREEKNSKLTYQKVLEAFLRQDPDVGLIGEVRNNETAERVVDMAMTGHLAFTTLHTNTALGAINRLRRLGVDERDIADVLKYVIAARLVRTVCTNCSSEQLVDISKYRKIAQGMSAEITAKAVGSGCDKCHWSGYSGRVLLTEILPIDNQAQTMIIDKRPLPEIEHYLIDNGEQVIWHNALLILKQGLTTLDELERVLPPFTN
jgi:type II secretory ATPase GspE/PulE/Tfp pilus assembly ATPase PilB-like protein